jgi:hypothetical protein
MALSDQSDRYSSRAAQMLRRCPRATIAFAAVRLTKFDGNAATGVTGSLVGADGVTRSAVRFSAQSASLLRGTVLGAEIDIRLHANRQRAWFGEFHKHFDDINVGLIALQARIIARRLHQRRDE